MEKRIMSVHFGRLVGSLFCVFAVASVSTANAQVTLHLTTPQQTTCTVVTDANGLSLVPGTTDLQATGVTFSGSACSGIPAPTPANFALSAPATVNTGSAFSVSWNVTGATACTGSATLAGNSTTLAGWTDSTSATPPRSITAPVDGTYVLTLTCSNTGGSVTSTPATVVASTGGGDNDNCPSSPLTRLTTSSISYVPSSGTRAGVNMTVWDNIWGNATSTDPTIPFPGRSNSQPSILSFGRTQYLAAKFTVPAGMVNNTYGWISHTEYNYGTDLTVAISSSCGDFAPSNPACKAVTQSGQLLVPWSVATPATFCPVVPGQTYFLNIKMTDPSLPGDGCNATSCVVGTSNNLHIP
jgi:hypothetical protein